MPQTLHPGDTGEDVRALKQVLHELGYSVPEDDTYDDETAELVREWQEHHHLDPDGVVGERTWDALFDRVGYVGQGGTIRSHEESEYYHHGDHGSAAPGEVRAETHGSHTEMDFGDGVTLTPAAREHFTHEDETHLHSANAIAHDRLHRTKAAIDEAANAFYAHAYTQCESLRGDADIPWSEVFELFSNGMKAVFPELEALKFTKWLVEKIVDAAEERAPQAAHMDGEDAKARARAAAYDLFITVTNAAELGKQEALSRIVPHLQATIGLYPEMREYVAHGGDEAAAQLCDYAGFYDPDQYSPYLTVRTQMEESFGIRLAFLRAALDGRTSANWQRITQAVDAPRAREDADIALERELRQHPRTPSQ